MNKNEIKVENIPHNKNMNRNTTMRPNLCINNSNLFHLSYIENGISADITFEPSNGGIGIRLNIPNSKLIYTINPEMLNIGPLTNPNLITIAKTIAIKKFDAGPASATIAGPHFPPLKL